jgi:hypothetical protein
MSSIEKVTFCLTLRESLIIAAFCRRDNPHFQKQQMSLK